MKKLIGMVGIGATVLVLIPILPGEGTGLEKKKGLAYVETAHYSFRSGFTVGGQMAGLKSNASDSYLAIGSQRASFLQQPFLRVEGPIRQLWIGHRTIVAGKLIRDEDGNLDRMIGISFGAGIAYRRYFKRRGEFKTFHPYWELGTVGVLMPYGMLGVTIAIGLGGVNADISTTISL